MDEKTNQIDNIDLFNDKDLNGEPNNNDMDEDEINEKQLNTYSFNEKDNNIINNEIIYIKRQNYINDKDKENKNFSKEKKDLKNEKIEGKEDEEYYDVDLTKNNQISIKSTTKIPSNITIEKFKVPRELKKTFIMTVILAGLGIILIICGFINAISEHTPGGGIMFWVLGGIVIIPGGFYSYQFYKAKKTKFIYVRKNIFDNIPQI